MGRLIDLAAKRGQQHLDQLAVQVAVLDDQDTQPLQGVGRRGADRFGQAECGLDPSHGQSEAHGDRQIEAVFGDAVDGAIHHLGQIRRDAETKLGIDPAFPPARW